MNKNKHEWKTKHNMNRLPPLLIAIDDWNACLDPDAPAFIQKLFSRTIFDSFVSF